MAVHRLERPERIAELAPNDTLERIGLTAGKVVCDIGAGTGVFTIPAAKICKSTVYAVEISEQTRKILRGKIDGCGIDIADNIRAVPDACCDIALLCAVLHELEDIPDMSAQIARVLKRSGIFAVIEFHKRVTPLGPPEEMRLSAEDTAFCFKDDFTVKEYFELGENYYCLVFNRGTS